MNTSWKVLRIAGLDFYIVPLPALIVTAVLWVLFERIGEEMLGLSRIEAIVGGLLATAQFWLSEAVHQIGHGIAARRTGHPMVGFSLWGLGTSLYPPDEGELSGRVHIQRALGGPIISLILAAIAALKAVLLAPVGGLFFWLAVYVTAINLLIFGLGALLPLKIGGLTSDGAVILHWLRNGNRQTA